MKNGSTATIVRRPRGVTAERVEPKSPRRAACSSRIVRRALESAVSAQFAAATRLPSDFPFVCG